MYQHISENSVIQAVVKHFHETPKIERVSTGKFNTTFYADIPGHRLVVRIAPPEGIGYVFYEVNMMAQEPDLHRLLLEKTTVPVPEIYFYDTDRDILASDFLIMRRMPGTPASQFGYLSPRVWSVSLKQLGGYLRQIHDITAEQYGYLGAHRPMEPQESWVNAFEIMWSRMIKQIVEMEAYSPQQGAHMIKLFNQYRSVFERDVPASLLHMDVWSQNILIDADGNVTGLLDWDRALWGDPRSNLRCSIIAASRSRRSGMAMEESVTNHRKRASAMSFIICTRYRNISLSGAPAAATCPLPLTIATRPCALRRIYRYVVGKSEKPIFPCDLKMPHRATGRTENIRSGPVSSDLRETVEKGNLPQITINSPSQIPIWGGIMARSCAPQNIVNHKFILCDQTHFPEVKGSNQFFGK